MKKILLLGYMGSGKSVIGKLMAKKLDILHYDLDNLIENHLQMSISEIFQQKGELFFRKVEHQILNEFINKNETFVLSLGGGTPCYANNHLFLLSENVTSFYLNASIETLFSRLNTERSHRPLIADLNPEEFKEYIAKHLFDRSFYYNQADFKVRVDNKTPEEITNEISLLLA